MIYYLDNEKVQINLDKLKLLGSGAEGIVYKYKDQAFKICKNSGIKKKECIVLKELNTKRILLPRKIIYNQNNRFKGYTTDYCKRKGNIEFTKKEKFIYELNKLIEEINYLSENKVYLCDWNYGNFIYDGKFRLVDPGQYLIGRRSSDEKKIYEGNYKTLCHFIAMRLFYNLVISNTEKINDLSFEKEITDLLFDLLIKSREDIIKFYSDEIKENETICEYAKRITKK